MGYQFPNDPLASKKICLTNHSMCKNQKYVSPAVHSSVCTFPSVGSYYIMIAKCSRAVPSYMWAVFILTSIFYSIVGSTYTHVINYLKLTMTTTQTNNVLSSLSYVLKKVRLQLRIVL